MKRILLNALLLAWALGTSLLAQDKNSIELKTGPDAVPKLPADAFLYATIHVKEIVTRPDLKLVPWEVISAAGLDNLGYDPLVIDRLDLIMGMSEDAERPVRYAIVARTSKPITMADLKPMAVQPLDELEPSIVQLNDRYMLVGDMDYIQRVVNEPAADGELKRQIARIGDSSLAWFAVVLSPIQKQVDELVQKADEKARADFEVILKKTKLLAARFDAANQSVPVVLEAGSEADAIAIEDTLKKLYTQMYAEESARVEATAAGLPKRIGDALIKYKDRFQEEFKKVGLPTRKAQRLTLSLNPDYYEISQMSANLSIITAILRGIQQAAER